MLGGSWGATLALLFAEKYPERVKALLLSKYDITVKSGACVNGIALCDGRLIVEDGVTFTRDESVLQPFVTAYRLKKQ